ncbi:hypothetical protein GCM10027341_43250 [Spirosoma knui]
MTTATAESAGMTAHVLTGAATLTAGMLQRPAITGTTTAPTGPSIAGMMVLAQTLTGIGRPTIAQVVPMTAVPDSTGITAVVAMQAIELVRALTGTTTTGQTGVLRALVSTAAAMRTVPVIVVLLSIEIDLMGTVLVLTANPAPIISIQTNLVSTAATTVPTRITGRATSVLQTAGTATMKPDLVSIGTIVIGEMINPNLNVTTGPDSSAMAIAGMRGLPVSTANLVPTIPIQKDLVLTGITIVQTGLPGHATETTGRISQHSNG